MEAGAGHLPTPPVLLRARKQDTSVRLRVSLLEKTCHTLATQVPPLEFPRHTPVSTYRSQGPTQGQAPGKPSIAGGASPGGPSPSHGAGLSQPRGAAGTGQLADSDEGDPGLTPDTPPPAPGTQSRSPHLSKPQFPICTMGPLRASGQNRAGAGEFSVVNREVLGTPWCPPGYQPLSLSGRALLLCESSTPRLLVHGRGQAGEGVERPI